MILLTGNYTYFNLLTIALCVPLLDDAALRTISRRPANRLPRLNGRLAGYVTSGVAAVLILLSGSQLSAEFFGVMPDSARA